MMNEGKALVGRLCQFWNNDRPDIVVLGPCKKCLYGESLPYIDAIGNAYNNAEAVAVEVLPVEIKPEPPDHETILRSWWKVNGEWWSVVGYSEEDHMYQLSTYGWHEVTWFSDHERADLPPE